MKPLVKYLKNREAEILPLLSKPRKNFTHETFHRLRVEIKKLAALFELINFCKDDFKRKETFKAVKKVFRQAGKIREIQLETAMLKKLMNGKALPEFMKDQKANLSKEKDVFFSLLDKNLLRELKSTFVEISPIISEIEPSKTDVYLAQLSGEIKTLLKEKEIQPKKLHELRKSLKRYSYTLKSLSLDSTAKASKDVLPDLLGNWHDYQVIMKNMEKVRKGRAEMNPADIIQLGKIESKVSKQRDLLLAKIGKALQEPEKSMSG